MQKDPDLYRTDYDRNGIKQENMTPEMIELLIRQAALTPRSLEDVSRSQLLELTSIMAERLEKQAGEIQELKETREWWQLAAQNTPDLIIAVNNDLSVQFINHAIPEYPISDIIGNPIYILEMESNDADLRPILLGVRDSGKPVTFETTIITPSRREIDYEMQAAAYSQNGEITGLIITARDISTRKLAQQEKEELHGRIRQMEKFESLKVMAGSIAHHFNNLLMVVLGNLELALSMLPSTETSRRNIEQADIAARRATELSKVMLTYVGKNQILPEPIDLVKTTRQILRIIQSSCPPHIKLKFCPETPTIPMSADPVQIRQAVMHMVNNGIEAIGEKPGIIRITAGVTHCRRDFLEKLMLGEEQEEGDFVFLDVEDDGCGMSQETVKKTFDPFFTTKFLGRGLGLPSVLGIVSSHRGAISLNSLENKGTRIRLLFPINDNPEIRKKTTRPGISSGHFKGTLLLADDEDMVLEVGQAMLQQLGFDVIPAIDGEDAIHKFRQFHEKIDCVILDLTMPKKNGAEVFQFIRDMKPHTKVILSSGYSKEEVASQFPNASPSGFLEKPFQMSRLADVLTAVLKNKSKSHPAQHPLKSTVS